MRRTVVFVLGLFFVLATAVLSAQEFKSAESGGFTLEWRVMDTDLEVRMSGPSTGWVAVGFDPENRMGGADMIMGYVSGDEVTVTDQYGTSAVGHSPDTEIGGSSDVSNTDGSESGGRTTIHFTIPLNSGDEYDNPLTPGGTHTVIMAAGPDGADNFSSYHGGTRTIIEITL
jgi:hypothetical protein